MVVGNNVGSDFKIIFSLVINKMSSLYNNQFEMGTKQEIRIF